MPSLCMQIWYNEAKSPSQEEEEWANEEHEEKQAKPTTNSRCREIERVAERLSLSGESEREERQ